MNGLLIQGQVVPVPGVTIIGPHEKEWSFLSPGDCRPRTNKPLIWVNHKTIADDPEHILEGSGPTGGAQRTAAFWAGDPRHSGAHLVAGHDGVVACLADLANVEAYHAGNGGVNARSVGMECCEIPGGGTYAAAYGATVEITLAGCSALGVQWQLPRLGSYNGHPLHRLAMGGADMVGIIQHRNVSEQRGEWDAGNLLEQMLVARGCEQFDFANFEDRTVWKARQTWLKSRGWYDGLIDGIAGPMTVAALKLAQFPDGIWARHRETAERLPIPSELLR